MKITWRKDTSFGLLKKMKELVYASVEKTPHRPCGSIALTAPAEDLIETQNKKKREKKLLMGFFRGVP